MDQQRRQPRFQSKAKIRWQRAMDELLIDAIFGATCRRDESLVPVHVPVHVPVRVPVHATVQAPGRALP